MADAFCSRCGVRLGFLEKLRGATICGSCSSSAPAVEAAGGQDGTTRVVVSGLDTVEDIAFFKRSLAHLPGVQNVEVRSAGGGQFEYLVRHDPGLQLGPLVQANPAWRSGLHWDVGNAVGGVGGDAVEAAGGQDGTTRVVVSGLDTVEDIAFFKRSLVHLPGVQNVEVRSAGGGQFEYLVRHDPGLQLRPLVQAIPAWRAGLHWDIGNAVSGVGGDAVEVRFR